MARLSFSPSIFAPAMIGHRVWHSLRTPESWCDQPQRFMYVVLGLTDGHTNLDKVTGLKPSWGHCLLAEVNVCHHQPQEKKG